MWIGEGASVAAVVDLVDEVIGHVEGVDVVLGGESDGLGLEVCRCSLLLHLCSSTSLPLTKKVIVDRFLNR